MPSKNRRIKERAKKYNTALGKRICELVAQGLSINKIITSESIRKKHRITVTRVATVLTWIRTIPEFRIMIEQAYRERADFFLERYLDVLDAVENDVISVHKGRFLAEHQQWLLEKLSPRILENMRQKDTKALQINAQEGSAIQIILAEPQQTQQLPPPAEPIDVVSLTNGDEMMTPEETDNGMQIKEERQTEEW